MTATRAALRTWLQSLPPPSPELRREQQLTLAANLLTLVVAGWQQWSLAALIWPYWIQSVSIGIFNAHRMQSLRRFSTEGLNRATNQCRRPHRARVAPSRSFVSITASSISST